MYNFASSSGTRKNMSKFQATSFCAERHAKLKRLLNDKEVHENTYLRLFLRDVETVILNRIDAINNPKFPLRKMALSQRVKKRVINKHFTYLLQHEKVISPFCEMFRKVCS